MLKMHIEKVVMFSEKELMYRDLCLVFQKQILLCLNRKGEDRLPVSSSTAVALGNRNITGRIIKDEEQPVAGVLVRLKLIVPQDSVYSEEVTEVENHIVEFKNGIRKVFVVDSANVGSFKRLVLMQEQMQVVIFLSQVCLQVKLMKYFHFNPAFSLDNLKVYRNLMTM
jgi:hypothetical protein